jgi:hypothetical protein
MTYFFPILEIHYWEFVIQKNMARIKNMATWLLSLHCVAVHPHEQSCTVAIDTSSCIKRKHGTCEAKSSEWDLSLSTTPATKHLVVMTANCRNLKIAHAFWWLASGQWWGLWGCPLP